MSQSLIELPRYQCHKQVWALKLRDVVHCRRGVDLHPEDARFAPITMPSDWAFKHDPQPGGYLVVYDDGHHSYSPSDVFEAGYTLVQ
jgi:hypothetical protein